MLLIGSKKLNCSPVVVIIYFSVLFTTSGLILDHNFSISKLENKFSCSKNIFPRRLRNLKSTNKNYLGLKISFYHLKSQRKNEKMRFRCHTFSYVSIVLFYCMIPFKKLSWIIKMQGSFPANTRYLLVFEIKRPLKIMFVCLA